ncbi:MAG TPA: MFS transporter [Steroidobacteraceae bacterium]|jgi:MFS family permease|nr:MFS transporter [Steroidobacteraceae bacterium]
MQLAWPTPGRAWWAVGVLTFAYIVSFVDRTILSLLAQPIKVDLSLNDTEMGLLAGPAFGLFYAAMGLPLGWLADRASRRGLIAVGAALWCAATAACGLAATFVQLLLARIAVGVGEAALSPAAMSIISDSFPKERRAAPIGVYAAAAAVGAGLAMIVGGTIVQLVSHRDAFVLPLIGEIARWQAAFVLVGVGGLILLPLLATILEPLRRNESAVVAGAGAARIDRFIRDHADFMVRHYVAVSFYSVVVYAVLFWVPTQFARVYGWSLGETGLRYGLVLLLFGGAGTVLGGILSAHLGKRGVAQPAIWITVAGMTMAGPLLAGAALASDGWTSLMWYAPALLFMTLPGGTAIQVVQEAVPNRLRGQASAIYYLSTSIIGNTLGPPSVGLLTDYVYGDPLRIGSALAIVAIVIAPLTSLLALSTRAPFARLVGQQATA